MRLRYCIWLLPAAVLFLGFYAEKKQEYDLKINLRWAASYPGDNWNDFRTGLIWGMSLLGATLPQGAFDLACTKQEDGLFELNLAQIGFPEPAHEPLAVILDSLRKTEEYSSMCGIDAGRFLVVLLHTPAHYYAISGIEKDLRSFSKKHGLDSVPLSYFPVVRSSIASGNRLVSYKTGEKPLEYALIAEEGTGRLETGNFITTEYEVIDVMPNGQLRYAIYDRNGQLEPATPAVLGAAGKPGKCMWCHESSLQILHAPTYRVPGHISPQAFTNEMKSANQRLRNYQNGLNTEVHFSNQFEHVHQEKIYIAFMEPSARRLSWEWGLALEKVEELVKYLQPHTHHEFPEMGQLYHREQVRHLAPFRTAKIPSSVREASPDEPDFLLFNRGK